MANALGYVSETKNGFEGSLAMMNLAAAFRLDKNTEKEMDGQVRKAKNTGREYISITLADPQIGPRRIYANLAPVKGKEGRHVILWNPS